MGYEARTPQPGLAERGKMREIKALQCLLGKKTLEYELLKQAVSMVAENWIARSPLLPEGDRSSRCARSSAYRARLSSPKSGSPEARTHGRHYPATGPIVRRCHVALCRAAMMDTLLTQQA